MHDLQGASEEPPEDCRLFFYYLVGVVSMAGTMKCQRLGDIVAETVVVRNHRASRNLP